MQWKFAIERFGVEEAQSMAVTRVDFSRDAVWNISNGGTSTSLIRMTLNFNRQIRGGWDMGEGAEENVERLTTRGANHANRKTC